MRDFNILVERYKNKVREEVPEPNRKLILDFAEQNKAEGLSESRNLEYLRCIHRIALILNKPFKKATKQDLVRVINTISATDTKCRGYAGKRPIIVKGKFSDNYVVGHKITAKKFFKWLNGGEEYPDVIKWLKCTNPPGKVQKEDILTPEETTRIINACETLRDRCFVHLTAETGARAGEMRVLKRKDIEFTNEGAIITLMTEKLRGGKKEKRQVPVVYCVPTLVEYMNSMKEQGPDAYLWVGHGKKNTGRLLELGTLEKVFKRAAERAGITKRCYLHLLRFSRATHVSPHLTESVMRNLFGWSAKSDMPSHYSKLSDQQAQFSLLRNVYGIENGNNGNHDTFCGRCKAKVQEGADTCWRCGMILREEVRLEKEKEKAEFEELRTFKRDFDKLVEDRVKEILAKTNEMTKGS
jgi:integrase